MSTNLIEKEVVKMEFDNSDFEKKTKESMSTIEKLKKALNFDKAKDTLSTFAKQANELDFSGLEDSVNTIAKRFTNLGIVGMTVVSRLTNALIDGVSRISHTISGMIVSGGISRAMNIEKAKFQLEGLGVAWEKIKDDIDYGVKDTAYGLDAAASVAAQLKTSGVEVGDNMKQALRAISGVASMTGSSYEDIGMIFTQVASQGRLMGDQLSRLSYRGLNAAGELAKALGKTEAEIREMASKGQIDFATFAKAMDDAFGAHAKDANKTLTGTLDNIRSAWSRIGAEFVEPIIRNEGELVTLLNTFRNKINDIKSAIIPVAEKTTDLLNRIISVFNRTVENIDIKEKVQKIGEGIVDLIGAFELLWNRIAFFGRKIKEVYREIFPKKEAIDITASFKKVVDAVKGFNFNSETIKKIQSVFRGLFSIVKLLVTVFKNLGVVVKPILNKIFKEAKKTLDIAAMLGDLISKFVEGTIKAEDFELTIEKLTESIQGSIQKIKDGFASLLDVFKDDEKGAKDAIDAIVDMVYGAVETILTVVENITGLDLSQVKNNLFEFSKDVKYYFKSLYDVYTQAGGGVKGFAAVILEVMKDIGKKITDFIENATGINLEEVKLKIENLFNSIKQKVLDFIEAVKPVDSLADRFNNLRARVKDLADSFHGLAKSAMTGLSKVLENPVGTFAGVKGIAGVIDVLKNLTTKMPDQPNVSSGFLGFLFGSLPENLANITDGLKKFFDVAGNAKRLIALAAGVAAVGLALRVFASGVAELSGTKDFAKTIGATTEMLLALGGIFTGVLLILKMLKGNSLNKKSIDNIFKTAESVRSSVSITSVSIAMTAVLILAISKSIKIIVEALKECATMDASILDHVTGLVEIFVALAILGEALRKLATKVPKVGVSGKFFIIYATTLLIIAEAVKVMSEAFVNINTQMNAIGDMDDLIHSLMAMAVMAGTLAGLVYALNKIKIANVQNLFSIGLGVIAISYAVKTLTEAIVMMKDLDPEEGLMGLIVTFTLVGEIMQLAGTIAGKSIGIKTSIAFLSIAAAMAILVHEINVLAKTPIDDIVKGFTTIVSILGAFVIAASFFQNELRGLAGAGFATLEFAAALYVMVKAMQQLKDMNPTQIADSFLVLMGALLSFALVLTQMSKAGLAASGFALLEIGAALYIIAQAIGYLGAQDIFNILKGAGSLVLFLELLCVTVTKFTMALSGAAALLIVCSALGVLAVAIGILAPLGSTIVFVGLTLVAFIAVLGAVAIAANFTAGYLMTGALIIAAALAAIGIGLMAVMIPIGIFALSIATIAVSAIAAADGLKVFVTTLAQLAVETATNMVTMSQLTAVMLYAGAAMASGGAALIVLGIGLAAFAVGATAAGLGATVLAGGLVLLAGALGALITVLQAAKLDGLVQSLGLDFGKNFSQGAADGIKGTEGVVIAAISALVKKSVGTFNKEAGINSPSTVFAESGKFIDMGLAEGITDNTSLVEDASKMLGEKTSKSLNTALVTGTTEGSNVLKDSVKQFATITEQGSEAAGANTGIGFMKGLQAIAPKVKAYAANIGKSAYLAMKNYLKIKSPSRLTEELGEYTGEGFILGMQNTESNVESSAEDLGKTAEKSLTTALSAAYNNLSSGVEDPTITPVLDLSEIQNGASRIDSMLSRDYANNISSNYKSERDYTAEQAQANASLMSGLNDGLISAIAANGMSDLPINVTVQLAGDAAGVFRLVLAENQRQTNMYGASPLLRG